MSLKNSQFSGITRSGHEKQRPIKIPQIRKKIISYQKYLFYLLIKIKVSIKYVGK